MSTPQNMTVAQWAEQWAHAVGTWADGYDGFKQYPFQRQMLDSLTKPKRAPTWIKVDTRQRGYSQAHWRKIQRERSAHRYATDIRLARAVCFGELLAPLRGCG